MYIHAFSVLLAICFSYTHFHVRNTHFKKYEHVKHFSDNLITSDNFKILNKKYLHINSVFIKMAIYFNTLLNSFKRWNVSSGKFLLPQCRLNSFIFVCFTSSYLGRLLLSHNHHDLLQTAGCCYFVWGRTTIISF